jgi:hypothetical protein
LLWVLIAVFLGLGVVGQCVTYRSPADFVELLTSPTAGRERDAEPATLAGAAGTFLRPFLGFALVLLWSCWLPRWKKRGVWACVAVTAVLMVLLLLANFSYNRGSLVAPGLALLAAFSVHARRISFLAVLLIGTAALFAAQAFGGYRLKDQELKELASADLQEAWSEEQFVEFFQIYGGVPQMTAYLLEQEEGRPLYWGRTLLCSVLYPVPVLGKGFREDSGVVLLNRLIYQDPDNVDQVISYDAELYRNFHIPGVVVGYAILGGLVSFCHGHFFRARQAVESYSWQLLALWLVFPGSLPVVSQICVYFFWPVYGYFAFILWRRQRSGTTHPQAQGAEPLVLADPEPLSCRS